MIHFLMTSTIKNSAMWLEIAGKYWRETSRQQGQGEVDESPEPDEEEGWAGWKKREEYQAHGFPGEPGGPSWHSLSLLLSHSQRCILTIANSVILALVELKIRVLGHQQFSRWQ